MTLIGAFFAQVLFSLIATELYFISSAKLKEMLATRNSNLFVV